MKYVPVSTINRQSQKTIWVVDNFYAEIGEPIPSQWIEYRQALRDLPNTTTPVLDPSGFLGISSIDWPVKPQ